MSAGWPGTVFALMLAVGLGDAAPSVAASSVFERWEWFKMLRVPKDAPFADEACCDVADGYPVEAESRADGFWYVRLIESPTRLMPPDWIGRWIQVPAEIIVRTNSIDEWGYLFIYRNELRCFVPPLRGM